MPARGSWPHRSGEISSSLIAVRDVLHQVVGVGEQGFRHPAGLTSLDPPLELPEFVLDDVITVTHRQPGLRRRDHEPHFGQH